MRGLTVGILSTGDMGAGVGAALNNHGHRAVTALAGRSARTVGLAEAAGIEDLGRVTDVVSAADLILSILPPDNAIGNAEEVAAAMAASSARPVFADCNAISPQRTQKIASIIEKAGAVYVDGGIIGLAPGKSDAATRFYVSGPDLNIMQQLDGAGIVIKSLGADIGAASGIKMCYAGLTKGTFSLQTAVLMVAEVLGLSEALREEFEFSQTQTYARMRGLVPRLPADAGRWIGEMEEIAATYEAAGITRGFHDGAADVLRVLARTPFASETRETLDPNRTLEDAIKVYTEYRNNVS